MSCGGKHSHLTFPTVHQASLADIWHDDPGFNAYRGTDWMPDACQTCDNQKIDWGGCRCQAMALTGDAANMDPVCEKIILQGYGSGTGRR